MEPSIAPRVPQRPVRLDRATLPAGDSHACSGRAPATLRHHRTLPCRSRPCRPPGCLSGPYTSCGVADVSLAGSASNAATVTQSSSGTGVFTNGNSTNASYTPSAADVVCRHGAAHAYGQARSLRCATPASSSSTLTINTTPAITMDPVGRRSAPVAPMPLSCPRPATIWRISGKRTVIPSLARPIPVTTFLTQGPPMQAAIPAWLVTNVDPWKAALRYWWSTCRQRCRWRPPRHTLTATNWSSTSKMSSAPCTVVGSQFFFAYDNAVLDFRFRGSGRSAFSAGDLRVSR